MAEPCSHSFTVWARLGLIHIEKRDLLEAAAVSGMMAGMTRCLRVFPVFLLMSCVLVMSGCEVLHENEKVVLGDRVKLRNIEFKCTYQGKPVTCVSASVKGNTGGYYALFEGNTFAKLVAKPGLQIYTTIQDGTRSDRVIREESEARAFKVLTAKAVLVEALPFDDRPDSRRDPMNILPAFMITAPLLVPATVLSGLTEENAITALEKRGVVVGAPWETVIKEIGEQRVRIDEQKQVMRYGPGIELVYRSAVIKFEKGKVSGIYTGEFYAD
ncbi:hypothetical protein [Phragmitibacter flavus]|nr:hypothetical protein [Phragmitibacter flavus]